jgi:uncharacterized protein YjaZ
MCVKLTAILLPCALLTAAVTPLSCRAKEVAMDYAPDDSHDFSRAERRAIEEVAERAIPDIRRLLPDLPRTIVLKVRSSKKVIPETGESGTNVLPDIVYWYVDASRSEGIVTIAQTQLRSTLFHELNHLVRAAAIDRRRFEDRMILEGLGTAFERDYGGGASPPWGRYPPDVSSWAQEVLALPDDAPRDRWLFQHPDGRRWIGFKVGTFLVDCATKSSGRTSAELARVPTDTILAMCPVVTGVRDGGS